jgi:hypothetical protein
MLDPKTYPKAVHSVDAEKRDFRWSKYAAAICGIWLAANSSFTSSATPGLLINNLACGLVVAVLSVASIAPHRDWLRWLVGTIGAWLLFSPLIFWAPTALQYDGSTLLAALIITFSFLIPGQPYARKYPGPEIPPGWTYNPSSWAQRAPLITIAFFGFFLARYLAAYQLGYNSFAWDPFFGNGTQRVLDSEISKAFIISDAGLGAVSYLIDALEGFLGGRDRWRSMPWAVVLFAASIVPAGVTSIVLVMLQPIGVGAWCTICLVAAAAMLIMVPFAFDELVATIQFLIRSKKGGASFWKTFFMGGPDVIEEAAPSGDDADSGWSVGVNFPISLVVSALVGIWIMASPAVLGISGAASDSQHLTGALIVTIAVSAMAEPCRIARFLNVPAALWLMASLAILPGFPPASMWTNVLAGVALAVLSLPKGKIVERYGTFDRWVR